MLIHFFVTLCKSDDLVLESACASKLALPKEFQAAFTTFYSISILRVASLLSFGTAATFYRRPTKLMYGLGTFVIVEVASAISRAVAQMDTCEGILFELL